MGKAYIFDHPLIQHKVSLMRKIETTTLKPLFNELARTTIIIKLIIIAKILTNILK